jgi:hypothetical protein
LFSKDNLLSMGFVGFIRLKDIENDYNIFPDCKGLYIIYIDDNQDIGFYNPGTGGLFKGKDPNVTIEELNRKWVKDANVLYIGRAGGTAKNGRVYNSTLRTRIMQYLKFGKGKNIGHWGGRHIWQIKESDTLMIAYKILDEGNPVIEEQELINEFKSHYNGRLPFANLI